MTEAPKDLLRAFQDFAEAQGLARPGVKQSAILLSYLVLTLQPTSRHDWLIGQFRSLYAESKRPNDKLLEKVVARIRNERARSLGKANDPRPIGPHMRGVYNEVLGRPRVGFTASRRH